VKLAIHRYGETVLLLYQLRFRWFQFKQFKFRRFQFKQLQFKPMLELSPQYHTR